VTDKLIEGEGGHGILPVPGTKKAIVTFGKGNRAILFDVTDGKIETQIATGQSPDALLIEPKTGLVVIFNGKSHDATLFDLVSKSVVGTIALSGKPEIAAADGNGKIFVNLEDKAEIAVLDIAARNVVERYKLPGCEAPTGLALDEKLGVLLSACDNKIAKLIDAKTGKDLGSLAIGKGPDGALIDDKRRLAFIPAGDGTLTVVSLAAADRIKVEVTVETQKGSKTAALDPESGRIYLPAVKFAAPESEGARPKPIPGTFEVLVVEQR
jgi:DNA-binding beta-propeller fold protein YncE